MNPLKNLGNSQNLTSQGFSTKVFLTFHCRKTHLSKTTASCWYRKACLPAKPNDPPRKPWSLEHGEPYMINNHTITKHGSGNKMLLTNQYHQSNMENQPGFHLKKLLFWVAPLPRPLWSTGWHWYHSLRFKRFKNRWFLPDQRIFKQNPTPQPPHDRARPMFRGFLRHWIVRKLCLIKAFCPEAAWLPSCLGVMWWRSSVVGLANFPAVGALFGSRRLQLQRGWPPAKEREGGSGWCEQGRVTAKAWRIWPAAFLRQFPTMHGFAATQNLASGRCKGWKFSMRESTPETSDKCEHLQRCTRFNRFSSFGTGITTITFGSCYVNQEASNFKEVCTSSKSFHHSSLLHTITGSAILSIQMQKCMSGQHTQNSWPTGPNLHNQPDKPFASKNICAWKARPLWILTLQL